MKKFIRIMFFLVTLVITAYTLALAADLKKMSDNNNPMGFMLINPESKWGLSKTQAIQAIKKDILLDLEIVSDNPEATTLLGYMTLEVGEKICLFTMLFTCKLDFKGCLSELYITWVSDDASPSDIGLIWTSIIKVASNKFNASRRYLLIEDEIVYASSISTPFGDKFEKGIQTYYTNWTYGNTESTMIAEKVIIAGKMNSMIKLEHRRV